MQHLTLTRSFALFSFRRVLVIILTHLEGFSDLGQKLARITGTKVKLIKKLGIEMVEAF